MHLIIERTPDVERRIGRSPSSRQRDIEAGLFMRPLRLGRRITGYLKAEVDEWISARARRER